MFHYPEDQPEDDGPLDAAMRVQADLLHEKLPRLDDRLRKIGVYVGDHQMAAVPHPSGPKVIIGIRCDLGDVAFSKRIQHPEVAAVDTTVKQMEKAAEIDGFLDARRDLLGGD